MPLLIDSVVCLSLIAPAGQRLTNWQYREDPILIFMLDAVARTVATVRIPPTCSFSAIYELDGSRGNARRRSWNMEGRRV
jgi:hypothetical protein